MARVDNFNWFDSHRDEIIKGHLNESVVIQNCAVKGYYENDAEAIKAMKGEDPETYVIQLCLPACKTDLYYYTGAVMFK